MKIVNKASKIVKVCRFTKVKKGEGQPLLVKNGGGSPFAKKQ